MKEFEMNNLLIIGAAGKMGKWFFDYFIDIKKNSNLKDISKVLSIDKIFLYDVKDIQYTSLFRDKDIIITDNIAESVRISDIILFCIPVKEIIKIIDCKTILFKRGTIIIEISSIKTDIHKVLLNMSKNLHVTT